MGSVLRVLLAIMAGLATLSLASCNGSPNPGHEVATWGTAAWDQGRWGP